MRTLIQHGAQDIGSAFIQAGRFGHVATMKFILSLDLDLDLDIDIINDQLRAAAASGNLEILDCLRNNSFGSINEPDLFGITALYCAAENGHAKLVEYLISNGARISAVTEKGDSALSIAASRGFPEVVKILLKNGANLESRNKSGHTRII